MAEYPTQTIRELYERKSVRVYAPRPVEPDVKQAVLCAAIQAPSAGNMALYTVLDITDPAKKAALAVYCDNQGFIATAPVVLVFCADWYRWYRLFRQQEPATRAPGPGDLALAQADAVIAAQNAVVAAQSLGLGSCYIGDIIENFEQVAALLNLPPYVVPAAMLCMGYPTPGQLERPKPPRFRTEELVHENGYDPAKADDLAGMLSRRNGREGEALDEWLRRFRERKWDCAFGQEMNRSCTAMAQAWASGKKGTL